MVGVIVIGGRFGGNSFWGERNGDFGFYQNTFSVRALTTILVYWKLDADNFFCSHFRRHVVCIQNRKKVKKNYS